MSLTLIKGVFRIVGASPDGDSVRFYPDNPTAFANAGIKVRLNANGGAQLRLDGIDALETHYQGQGGGGMWHQPSQGQEAATGLLDYLGFTAVDRNAHGVVTSAEPSQVPGYIMSRFADKYGRAVAFAFPGKPPKNGDDGRPVFLDVKHLRTSANYVLLHAGLVYPTFYSLLYPDLRQDMATAATTARHAGTGVWAQDCTTTGFTLESRKQLQSELVILPKLFRRLVDYLGLDESGAVGLGQFAHYLDTRDDRLFTVPDGHSTEFETLVTVEQQTVKLTVPPERIVFIEA